MVTVTFKLMELGTSSLTIDGPVPFVAILQQCAQETDCDISGIIAVRNGRLLSQDDLVYDGDHVDVFPAIAGG